MRAGGQLPAACSRFFRRAALSTEPTSRATPAAASSTISASWTSICAPAAAARMPTPTTVTISPQTTVAERGPRSSGSVARAGVAGAGVAAALVAPVVAPVVGAVPENGAAPENAAVLGDAVALAAGVPGAGAADDPPAGVAGARSNVRVGSSVSIRSVSPPSGVRAMRSVAGSEPGSDVWAICSVAGSVPSSGPVVLISPPRW
ncbi:hypothetical protein [Cellulomonas endometrii]|uniref:hypothetical protein n=1 Tax=Cellulomonas endometrii TaxID=3036301 RepID=UPI003D15902D